MFRSFRGIRRHWLLCLAGGMLIAASPATARASALTAQDVETIRRAAEAVQGQAEASVAPLAPGEVKVMQAVIMSVKGSDARWRPDAQTDWKRAAVDDVLDPGTEVRTGRRTRVALRVGKNATILVDRHSQVVLPQIVHVGDTLRTAAEVKRGRVDFKVDRVGLTNNFSVVTPSTTLAVRGTGFAVQYGALNGTEIAASRFNEIYSIEISYFLTRLSYLLSASATTSDKHQNPAVSALFQTYGPPPLVSALIEDPDTPALLETALTGTPLYNDRRVDINLAGAMENLDNPLFEEPDTMEPPPPPPPVGPDFTGFGELTFAGVAEFICVNLFDIFLTYDDLMIEDFGSGAAPGGFAFQGLNELFADINEFVCQGREGFVDQDLITIIDLVNFYCLSEFQAPSDVELCVQNFVDAGVEHFLPPP